MSQKTKQQSHDDLLPSSFITNFSNELHFKLFTVILFPEPPIIILYSSKNGKKKSDEISFGILLPFMYTLHMSLSSNVSRTLSVISQVSFST